jgi:hypothetical protein
MMAIIRVLLLCLMFFTGTSTKYQPVKTTNIHFRKIDDKIEIFYDLQANRDTLLVSVSFFKKSDPAFRHFPNPKYLTGDVGKGIFSGTKRKIVWQYKNESESLFSGDGFYFKVRAKKILHSDSLRK